MQLIEFQQRLTRKVILIAVVLIFVLGLAAPAAAQQAQPISPGDTITGQITADSSGANYDLVLDGQAVVVKITSDDFQPTLGYALVSGTGFSFVGGVGDTLFVPPLADNQSVQIQAGPQSFPSEGSYTLTVTAVQAAPIAYGETVTGTLDGLAPQFFTFEGQPGDLVTVAATGENNIDTGLKLYSPGSLSAAAADADGGIGLNPEIYRAVVTGSGTSYIEVSPTFPEDSGAFSLSLTQETPPVLADGTPTTVRLGPSHPVAVLAFDGRGGQTVQLTINSLAGDTTDAAIWVYEAGERLALVEEFNPEEAPVILQASVRFDEPVVVIFMAGTRFDEARAGAFEVTLTRL